MRRREYISTAAGAGATGLAGCLSIFESDVQLAGLLGANYANEPRTLDIRVLDNGSEYHTEQLDFDAAEDDNPDRVQVECNWPDRGQFVIEALDDDEELVVDLSDSENECLVGAIMIDFPPVSEDSISWYEESCSEISDDEYLC